MSTLHTALAELADEWERNYTNMLVGGFSGCSIGADTAAKRIRSLLAAHPAPEPSAQCLFDDQCILPTGHEGLHRSIAAAPVSEVRLTEDEREEVRQMAYAGSYSREKADRYVRTVERILAARLAEVAQPAGETRVEWGVKCDHGMSTGRLSEQVARSEVANAVGETCRPRVVSRTVTSFIDVVGEWEEVAGDE